MPLVSPMVLSPFHSILSSLCCGHAVASIHNHGCTLNSGYEVDVQVGILY